MPINVLQSIQQWGWGIFRYPKSFIATTSSSTNNLHVPPSLQPAHQLLLANHQIRANLIKAMRPVQILLQRILPPLLIPHNLALLGSPALLPSSPKNRRRDCISMHPVQEPLDDPKCDEPSHIQLLRHLGVLHAPSLDALPLPEGKI